MKKISLVLVGLFAAGFVMAQNTSSLEQVGASNETLVTQTGSNDATSHQFGDENDVTIVQSLTGNIAVADQLDGDKNDASIEQEGTSNQAYLVQGMKSGYLGAGYTSSDLTANENLGSITQIGASNEVDFVQVGDDNEGAVAQDGLNNTGYVYQGWAYGFWGETAITSALSSNLSDASVEQIGNTNYGAVWQYGGTENDANILQNGNTNTASIAQGFIYNDLAYNFQTVFNTSYNTASLTQSGDNNSGKLFQLGDYNTFNLTQNGAGNTVGGRGLSGLLAVRNGYFEQEGDGNTFTGEQNNGATLDDESFQVGDDNEIDLIQGAGDTGLIQQLGDDNYTSLTQGGGINNATILQSGNTNSATVTQN